MKSPASPKPTASARRRPTSRRRPVETEEEEIRALETNEQFWSLMGALRRHGGKTFTQEEMRERHNIPPRTPGQRDLPPPPMRTESPFQVPGVVAKEKRKKKAPKPITLEEFRRRRNLPQRSAEVASPSAQKAKSPRKSPARRTRSA